MDQKLPSKQEILALAWRLLQKAEEGEAVADLPACAKLAELLLKHESGGSESRDTLSHDALEAIEGAS